MTEKEAERFWQSKSLEAYKTNMAGVRYYIERRPYRKGYSYCVSEYVGREKSSEYWPNYRGGRRYGGQNPDGSQRWYGEEFLATETQTGESL